MEDLTQRWRLSWFVEIGHFFQFSNNGRGGIPLPTECAKLRASRAFVPYVSHVPTCLRAFPSYLPSSFLRALRDLIFVTCLRCLHFFKSLRVFIFLPALRVLFIYVPFMSSLSYLPYVPSLF